jgi:hypothetical protein
MVPKRLASTPLVSQACHIQQAVQQPNAIAVSTRVAAAPVSGVLCCHQLQLPVQYTYLLGMLRHSWPPSSLTSAQARCWGTALLCTRCRSCPPCNLLHLQRADHLAGAYVCLSQLLVFSKACPALQMLHQRSDQLHCASVVHSALHCRPNSIMSQLCR